MGNHFSKTAFDFPEPGPKCGSMQTQLISFSFFFCLVQHGAEWPDYYCIVDCRSLAAYKKGHVVGAKHATQLGSIDEATNGITVVAYDNNETSPGVTAFLSMLGSSGSTPTAIYVVQGSFSKFKKVYKVVVSSFTKTEGEQPGPVELLPATKANPAVYLIHRNQFQHCKTTIAYLGCSTVLNISSRRLFLKTAAIKLENVQFDNTNEPYDEAIAALEKHIKIKPKSHNKGNILIIDETGCDYGSLLVGWYLFQKGFNLEKICEHLSNKVGELDPWYLDVLRAWTES